ncbi:MAG: hypothetical protein II567_00965 [Candidatus Riflebacteria bacterium]|nr:hypothetical protein [Candidatus Riflebacteria bacterium]
MKKSKQSIYTKLLFIMFITAYIVITTGCGKSGEVDDPVSYLTPSIQNLQTKSTNIAKCTGGILSFTCDWTSPQVVSSANAYLSFVKTIDLPITEPIGVIGSASEMIVSSSTRAVVSDESMAIMTNDPIPFDFGSMRLAKFNYASTSRTISNTTTTASETVNDPIATADFYRKYSEPILIPVRINTNETAGQFFAQIPFTTGDIASAPLGVHQMMLYMKINGCKTNTLSFELTFVP